jgi:hypothetical protein
MRYFPDGSVEDTWLNDPIPPKEWGPATLILTGGEYHFADVKDYYNIHAQSCVDLEGSVVISETGQLSGHTTYILNDLDTINDFMGQVEIIIYDEVSNIPYKHELTPSGSMFMELKKKFMLKVNIPMRCLLQNKAQIGGLQDIPNILPMEKIY